MTSRAAFLRASADVCSAGMLVRGGFSLLLCSAYVGVVVGSRCLWGSQCLASRDCERGAFLSRDAGLLVPSWY